MSKHDVVVIGAGHNGLVAGAYLAKAGMNVCIVERADYAGGAVSTKEITVPGFKHDCCGTGHFLIQYNPLIVHDELKLKSKFGLKYIYPEAPVANIYPDDTNIMLYADLDKTCQSIAKFSEKDAEVYRQYIIGCKPIIDMLIPGMFSPPVPLGPFFAQLDSSPLGQSLLNSFFMSAWDVIDDMFEHDKTKLFMAKMVTEPLVAPEEKGTGMNLYISLPILHYYPVGIPEGGSGELSNSLVRCLESHGGQIRLNSEVNKITIKSGKATGVVLTSGEEIEAGKAVVANLDPRIVFPQMISDVDSDFLGKVQGIKNPSFSVLLSHYALNEAPKFKAGDEVLKGHSIEPLPWVEEFRRGYDSLRYGEIPSSIQPLVCVQSYHDPTRAPKGKHVMYMSHYVPWNLKDGGPEKWDEIKEKVADFILDELRKYTTNMSSENIIMRKVHSPMDYVRMNPNLYHASIDGPGVFLNQMFSHRPIAELGQLRGPFEGLYWSGHAFHPAGAISGAGRNTVQVIMSDLDMEFDDIIA